MSTLASENVKVGTVTLTASEKEGAREKWI
jgi:hypothetical protein